MISDKLKPLAVVAVPLIGIALMLSQIVKAGGIGGSGTPPAVSVEMMSTLKAGALDGDLIEYTEPGSEPVYLQPDVENMTDTELPATVLPSGEKVIFKVEKPVESKVAAFSMARAMKSSMGALPVLPVDILRPMSIIKTVKVGELDDETLQRISAPGSGGGIPPAAATE